MDTNTERKLFRFRKLSELEIEVTLSCLFIVVIILTLANIAILFLELYSGTCLYQHLNISGTEELFLIKRI